MIWRNLWLTRAFAASGLLSMSCTLAVGSSACADDSDAPLPAADSAIETISVLDAQRLGTLGIEVRGNGEDTVRVKLNNKGTRKLRVVLPPGLVASSAVAQGPGGGAGGGGGFQSMGLGAVGNQAGGFGRFAQGGTSVGFRSVAPSDVNSDNEADVNTVAVPAGQTVDFTVPAVCLNYGAPTPNTKNRFQLVDVATYTPDTRVQRALRTLATVGTSHGVAQAAMWQVCNGTSFNLMLGQGGKLINSAEVALAARFVRALDGSAADLDAPRVFISVTGDVATSVLASRLQNEIDGLRILGMPVQAIAKGASPSGFGPILHLGINLTTVGDNKAIRGRVVVQVGEGSETLDWSTLTTARLEDLKDGETLSAKGLAYAVDGAVASALVSTKVVRRSANGTTLEVRNRLPMTLASLAVRAGSSANSPVVDLAGLGVGPNRTGQITVPAAQATVDRVTLNGL